MKESIRNIIDSLLGVEEKRMGLHGIVYTKLGAPFYLLPPTSANKIVYWSEAVLNDDLHTALLMNLIFQTVSVFALDQFIVIAFLQYFVGILVAH